MWKTKFDTFNVFVVRWVTFKCSGIPRGRAWGLGATPLPQLFKKLDGKLKEV